MYVIHPGEIVRARRQLWRVAEIRTFQECRALTLTGINANAGNRCELLWPFDAIDVVREPSRTLRRASLRRWRGAAKGLLAQSGGAGVLQAAKTAAIDILPHQLEPAAAVLQGSACRLLLADEVGLGKTIQACLVVAELRARGAADRVLVLTPPGLRDQWREELRTRFGIEAAIADFRSVRRRVATLPPDMNPWSTWPVVIVSIDFIKRPEVLPSALNALWDVVVIDEAHRIANDGERRRSAAALTSRSGYVLLLTATPHSGDSSAFQALCGLGAQNDPLLIFRRTRQVLPSAMQRRIHRLPIRATATERRMFARLEILAKAVRKERGDGSRDMWIALALLRKRGYSSAQALYLSVVRRLDSLIGAADGITQLALPLDDFGETSDDAAPDWHPALRLQDEANERRLLKGLAIAAHAAAQNESKICAIRRLLRRTTEAIIIFTEYRDTLAWLASQLSEPALELHGGLSRLERAEVVDTFTRGSTRVLLATDAAAEGLNLHQVCRVIVNLELPWNPMRLEQRIGRVDRIGQRRIVHAFHLVGADSGESRLLDDLRARIARAQTAIGAPDPLDGALEPDKNDQIGSHRIDVSAEVVRIRLAKALKAPNAQHERPLVARTRNARTRARLGGRRLWIWEHAVEDGRARPVCRQVVAITDSNRNPTDLEAFVSLVDSVSTASTHSLIAAARAFAESGLARTNAITRATAGEASYRQPGLFDRRVDFAHAALRAADDNAAAALKDRRDMFDACAQIAAVPPRLRLVLEP